MMGLKPGRWTSAVLALTLLSVSPLYAQRTTFNPVISLDYLYTDNVQYVGENGTADSGFRLGLQLPVVRDLRKGTLAFIYASKVDQYKDFSQLDNTGHRVTFNLNLEPTQLSRLTVAVGLSRTQDQGDPTDPDGEIFIGRRTERDRASFNLSYRNRLSGRFLWGFSTRYADWSFKDIEGFDPGASEPIADRSSARASLELLRSLSRSTNLGVRLSYGRFELDQGGGEDSREAALVLEHIVGRRTNLTVGLGVFESEPDEALRPGGVPGSKRTGSQGFVTLSRQLRKLQFSLNGIRSPTAGGSSAGTSTDSSLGFALSNGTGRRLNWSVDTRFSQRDPSDRQLETIETAALGLSLEWEIHRTLRLRLSPLYTRQLSQDQRPDSLILRGGLGFAWAPLQNTRLGGGNG